MSDSVAVQECYTFLLRKILIKQYLFYWWTLSLETGLDEMAMNKFEKLWEDRKTSNKWWLKRSSVWNFSTHILWSRILDNESRRQTTSQRLRNLFDGIIETLWTLHLHNISILAKRKIEKRNFQLYRVVDLNNLVSFEPTRRSQNFLFSNKSFINTWHLRQS